MYGLEDKPILVTGASGGIGAATVRKLVEAGVEVYAGGRDIEKLESLAAETGCRALPCDLTSQDSFRETGHQ
jgi:L-xylulose reductase